ncbi:MAG: cytochrome c [Acidobacteriota bacterium]
MMRGKLRPARIGAAGATMIAAVLSLPAMAAAQTPAAPNFSKDVAPIFQAKCEACHRPDSIAPMSLMKYSEARPWARAIKTRVLEHQMPPFQIDRTVGITKFKNDDSLSDADLNTIVKWVDAGAPQGDPKDLPPAKEWPAEQGWSFAKAFGQSEPDLIIKSHEFSMPAQAQDAWDKRVTESGITEPRWVRAIEIRPSSLKGRRITHHAIAYLEQTEPGAAPGGFGLPAPFMEWAVGKQGEMMRPDTGKLLLPGSKFRWDIHYSQAGEAITSNVEMGIYFYPKGQEPKYRNRLSLVGAALGTLDVRPNAITVTEGFYPLREAARIESFQPHMHLRGKAMMVEALLPSGQRQVLSNVSDFNFQWMTTFVYADDVAPLLPKGTLLKVTAWHDNTTAKKSNPDPNQWVGWGDRTVDEMAHAWINIVYLSEDEYKAEVDRRKAVTTTAAPERQQ